MVVEFAWNHNISKWQSEKQNQGFLGSAVLTGMFSHMAEWNAVISYINHLWISGAFQSGDWEDMFSSDRSIQTQACKFSLTPDMI